MILWIIIGIVVILALWIVGMYNGFVKARIKIENSWSDINVFLKKRFDLIPNLVNTVKGEANFEQTTLQNVIQARASATQIKVDPKDLTPEKLQQFQQAQGQLSQALGRLLMVSENYPTCAPMMHSVDYRRNWKEPRTESKYPATISTRQWPITM